MCEGLKNYGFFLSSSPSSSSSSSSLLLFAEFCKEYDFDDINCFVFRTERLTLIGDFKPAIHA